MLVHDFITTLLILLICSFTVVVA